MASSSPSDLFDPIRKKWVRATPEERIRQGWIRTMIEKLKFPPSLIAVEKELANLPHLSGKTVPQRRLDILAFVNQGGRLLPLIMIECKAVALNATFANQVIGYNDVVQAPFIAIANEKQILTGCYDTRKKLFEFTAGLPSYEELASAADRSFCV